MNKAYTKLIEAWIQHQETFWAWEKLHDIVDKSHDEAWPIVIQIAKNTDSKDVLGALAAGSMEDMLCAFGDHYYDLVKNASEECPNFRCALLMGIMITGKGSERIEALIKKLSKQSLKEG